VQSLSWHISLWKCFQLINTGNGRAKLSSILPFALFSSPLSSHSYKRSVERVNADYSTPKTQWQALRDPATRSGHSSDGPTTKGDILATKYYSCGIFNGVQEIRAGRNRPCLL